MLRRDFLTAGAAGVAAGAFGIEPAIAAQPAPSQSFGRSVLDFGVKPGTDENQTNALQSALDEIAASGQPAFLPPGLYRIGGLSLPANAAIFGVPGHSNLLVQKGEPGLLARNNTMLRLSGIGIRGQADGPSGEAQPPALEVTGGQVMLDQLTFEGTSGDALTLEACSGEIDGLRIINGFGYGIEARASGPLTIRDCAILNCQLSGIACAGATRGLLQIAGNRVAEVGEAGIAVEGDAMISGNIAERCGSFGLRLGGRSALGTFSAVNNAVRGSPIGIGVSSASGGYGVISLNMISGARDGAIRALDGDRVVGPDLARASAESFRNLAIAGNVPL